MELLALLRTIIREKGPQLDAHCFQNTDTYEHELQGLIKGALAGMINIPQPCQCASAPIQSYSGAASGLPVHVEQIVHATAPGNLTDLPAPSTPSPYSWRGEKCDIQAAGQFASNAAPEDICSVLPQTPAKGAMRLCPLRKVQLLELRPSIQCAFVTSNPLFTPTKLC